MMEVIKLCLETQSLSTRIGLQFEIVGYPTIGQRIACAEAFASAVMRKAKLPNEISVVLYPGGAPNNSRNEWQFYDLDIGQADWRIQGRVAYNPYTRSLALCKVE